MSKVNRKGLTPNLRFPEFLSEPGWDLSELEEISDRIQEKAGDSELETISISAGIGFVSQKEKFSRDISGQQYKNYIKLKKGEFAYNKGNSKKFPQGCIYKLKEFNEGAAPTSFICFRFKPSVVPDFYQGYFESNFHGKQLTKYITSGARMDGLLNISPDNFFKIILPTPSKKEEQQKIADCLSSLDEFIHAETERLEALQAHKKGLMQQLFPAEGETVPKLRFPEFQDSGEWVEKMVKELFNSFSGGTPTTTRKEYYGGKIPFIRSAEINKDSTELFLSELGLKNSSAKLVRKGDVLVALYGANSGDVGISKIDGAINQAILCLRSEKSNEFLYHYLTFLKEWIIQKFIQGGQGNLSGEIIKTLKLRFPDNTDEQEVISKSLSECDSLISSQSEKIESLKSHKKGLLQQLFPQLES